MRVAHHRLCPGVLLLCALPGIAGTLADADQAGPKVALPEILVEGRVVDPFERTLFRPDQIDFSAPDVAGLMREVPGGNVVDNGPLSSQVQYRGMFGPRINVLIDGMHLQPGGPNWMDPPLHYIPRPLLQSMAVVRGIASVSSGGQTMGGTVQTRFRRSHFADGPALAFQGTVDLAARSVDEGLSGGGLLGLANHRHRFHTLGASDIGSDAEFGDGTIGASEHERHHYGAGYGYRRGGRELSLSYHHSDTSDSGNPSLPMDIDFLDTDIGRLKYTAELARERRVEVLAYYSRVEHRMNNFKLRPPPDFNPMSPGPDRRVADAASRSGGYRLSFEMPLLGGDLTAGADGLRNEHDMQVGDPDNPMFFVTQFNDAREDRYGFFAEWRGPLRGDLSGELGLRYNRVETDADAVDAAPAHTMAPPRRLRDGFNAADRARSDNNVDWVVKLGYQWLPRATLELGAARKTRSPSYLERYLWLPLEVTAGLADGNNYVGDLGLKPEVAHEIELGLAWEDRRVRFSPRIFYRRVDDFVQGTASEDADVVAVSSLNGDSTPLRFSNVDAEFFGGDAEFSYRIARHWQMDAVLSYVRGKRRDIDDNLYRIPPAHALLALSYQRSRWQVTLEAQGAARADDLSRTIVLNEPGTSNAETSGYAVYNVHARWHPLENLHLTVGADNLFDRRYVDHLSGFNRVAGSDTPPGERLPGRGRNVFMRAAYSY